MGPHSRRECAQSLWGPSYQMRVVRGMSSAGRGGVVMTGQAPRPRPQPWEARTARQTTPGGSRRAGQEGDPPPLREGGGEDEAGAAEIGEEEGGLGEADDFEAAGRDQAEDVGAEALEDTHARVQDSPAPE